MRESMTNQRANLETLFPEQVVAGAAKHFQSPKIVRRADALTPAELDAWYDDDELALRDCPKTEVVK